MNQSKPVTFFQKFIFSLGMFPMTILIMAIGSFVIYYYTEYVGIPMAAISLMLLITRIWDAVNDPLFGIIADKTPEVRFGKYKMYLLIGGILGAVSYYFMFSLPTDIDNSAQMVWLYVTYIGVSMALTIFQISNFGLYVKLTSTPKERTSLSGMQTLMGAFGGLIPSILLIPMVRILGKGDGLAGFSRLAGLVSLAFILCTVLIAFLVPEPVGEVKHEKKVSIITSIKVVLMNKPALLVSVSGFFAATVAIITSLLTPYFAKYIVGDEMFMSYAGLVSLLGMLIIIPFSGKLVERFGTKNVFFAASAVQILSRLMLNAFIGNVGVMLGLLLIGSMGAIMIPILIKALLADAADYGQAKYNVDSKGVIASVRGAMDKGANAVTPALVGLILSIIGFTSGAQSQSEEVVQWIMYIFVFGPIIANILTAIPIIFFRMDKQAEDFEPKAG